MHKNKSTALSFKHTPIIFNFLIFLFSATGFLLSCFFAQRDGYSHWLKRLLYFTQQSNLWIGITSLIFAILLIKKNTSTRDLQIISILKYIFTISITITGVIFCTLLAPFADFEIWTFANLLTHIVVPVLSICDFFTNPNILRLQKKHIWLALVPPLVYFILTSILCMLKIDFGRGLAYPYFFMDFFSEAGFFGFIAEWPPQIGSFYWIVFFFIFIYLLSTAYFKIHTFLVNKREQS